MLKDITLGQYFPGNSVIHRIDPRIKVVLTVAFVVAVFLVQGFAGYGILAAFLVLAGGLSRMEKAPFREAFPVQFPVPDVRPACGPHIRPGTILRSGAGTRGYPRRPVVVRPPAWAGSRHRAA